MTEDFDSSFSHYLLEASFKQFRKLALEKGIDRDDLIGAYKLWKRIPNHSIKDKLNFNNYLKKPDDFIDVVFSYEETRNMKPMKSRTDVILETDRFVLVSPQNPKAAIQASRAYEEYGCDEQPKEYLPTWCISSSNASRFWNEYLLKNKKFRMVFFVLVKHPSSPDKSRYAIAMDADKIEAFAENRISLKKAALEIQDVTQKMYDTNGVSNISNLKEILSECHITLRDLSLAIRKFIIENISIPKDYVSPNFKLFGKLMKNNDSERLARFVKMHTFSFNGFYFEEYPFLLSSFLVNDDAFESIVKSGVDVNKPFRKLPPLWFAIRYRHDSKANLLLKYGADPNAIIKGQTVSDFIVSGVLSGTLTGEDTVSLWNNLAKCGACTLNQSSKKKELVPIKKISKISDIFHLYKKKSETFLTFQGEDYEKMLKILKSGDIVYGAIDTSSLKRDSLLTTIIKNPFLEKKQINTLVTVLVSHGANINYKNGENETGLSLSILRGLYEVVICLIMMGANPNAGNTLENFIISENKFEPRYLHTKIAYFLEAYGLDISLHPNIERYIKNRYNGKSTSWRDKSYAIMLKKVKGITKKDNRVAPVADEEEDEIVGLPISQKERQWLFKAMQKTHSRPNGREWRW